jgi:hypothetical protein
MIHFLQCLCGPARHAIYAVMYDDKDLSPQDAREGLEALIEMMVDHRMINRRCEICDKDIREFHYEDGVSKEQDWDKAQREFKRSEAAQTATRLAVQAQRRAGRN